MCIQKEQDDIIDIHGISRQDAHDITRKVIQQVAQRQAIHLPDYPELDPDICQEIAQAFSL